MKTKSAKSYRSLFLSVFLISLLLLQGSNAQIYATYESQHGYNKKTITDNFKITLENPSSQGNFGYTFPVELPQGTDYLTPTIALVYNSEALREKFLGVGWELVGYNQIRRNDRLGVPWYDNRDSYIITINGKELVFDINGNFEEKTDYTIKPSGENWILTESDGSVQIFTKTVSSSKGIYLWTLAEKKSGRGNTIKYNYDLSDNATGVAYLKTISYQSQEKGEIIITFNYTTVEDLGYPKRAEQNTDPSYHYWAGFPICYGKRLTGITVNHDVYTIGYKKSNCSLRLLVDKIESTTGRLASFTYQSDNVQTGWEKSNKWLLSPIVCNKYDENTDSYALFDFNNDGLPDFIFNNFYNIEISKTVSIDLFPQVYLNDGQDAWAKGFDFATTSSNIPESWATKEDAKSAMLKQGMDIYQSLKLAIFDENNDGFLDVIMDVYPTIEKNYKELGKGKYVIYYNDGSGRFNIHQVITIEDNYWKDDNDLVYLPKLLDLNCDGVNDYPIRIKCRSDAVEEWVMDFNGDRFPDLFWCKRAKKLSSDDYIDTYALNLGDGSFEELYQYTTKQYVAGEQKMVANYPDLPKQVQFFAGISEIFPDINGDRVGDKISKKWDAKEGKLSLEFSDSRYNITGLTSFDSGLCRDYRKIFADINNDGFLDALLASGTFLNTAKPDLITGVSGSENYDIKYTRVSVRTQDEIPKGTVRPDANIFRWTVQSLTKDGTTYNFAYTGGLHDLFRREFRGFEKVDVTTNNGVTTYLYDITDWRKTGKIQAVNGQDYLKLLKE